MMPPAPPQLPDPPPRPQRCQHPRAEWNESIDMYMCKDCACIWGQQYGIAGPTPQEIEDSKRPAPPPKEAPLVFDALDEAPIEALVGELATRVPFMFVSIWRDGKVQSENAQLYTKGPWAMLRGLVDSGVRMKDLDRFKNEGGSL